jgi:hypothetical protein
MSQKWASQGNQFLAIPLWVAGLFHGTAWRLRTLIKRALWRFCSCCCAPYCEKVEVVDYYTTEVETLTLQIKELKEISLKAPLGKQNLYVTYLSSLHIL